MASAEGEPITGFWAEPPVESRDRAGSEGQAENFMSNGSRRAPESIPHFTPSSHLLLL